jgi:RNA polymerase subunit RPABC4/transcription elongation factor Spt4
MEQKEIDDMKACGSAVGPKPGHGVCPICRTFVGAEALIFVRHTSMCPACGQRDLELWKSYVKASLQ